MAHLLGAATQHLDLPIRDQTSRAVKPNLGSRSSSFSQTQTTTQDDKGREANRSFTAPVTQSASGFPASSTFRDYGLTSSRVNLPTLRRPSYYHRQVFGAMVPPKESVMSDDEKEKKFFQLANETDGSSGKDRSVASLKRNDRAE